MEFEGHSAPEGIRIRLTIAWKRGSERRLRNVGSARILYIGPLRSA